MDDIKGELSEFPAELLVTVDPEDGSGPADALEADPNDDQFCRNSGLQ